MFFLCCICTFQLSAQNPISPPGVYIADPSAHVWQDGKLYIYGSVDESCNYYCSRRYHVMSTDDLRHWTVHENVFHSDGENDEVPGSDALLYAPDCQYKDGRYYLYYCMPDNDHAEGVAVSSSPDGDFKDGQKINLAGHNEIDPSLFIDDDGQAYYLWGQFNLKMARMKPNMKEIDTATIQDKVLTETDHFFHEGAYMVKRNELYYLVYADLSRADKPTCIGYAVSKKPFGPYRYGGVIVDNRHCNPNNWNNHGSIAEFNGQWFVFYHRSTHGCNKMRKACVEPISFRPDGSIPEVEMTSQGVAGPLPATRQLEAEQACLLFGNTRIEREGEHGEKLAKISNRGKFVYKYIDFKEGINKLTIRVKPGAKGGTLVASLDKPWHHKIATFHVEGSKNHEWQILSAQVDNPGGVHSLWFTFWAGEGEKIELDWLVFGE